MRKGLSADVLGEAISRGGPWLVELCEQGRFEGKYLPLRRLGWAVTLGIVRESTSTWTEDLQAQRQTYASLLQPGWVGLLNPFSWGSDELQEEIKKDVDRTFPEDEYLSCEGREPLQRILYHWCSSRNLGTDSYRQGMNELAAVVLSVSKQGESMDEFGATLCGEAHTEADAFTLFSRIMDLGLRPMFTSGTGCSSPTASPKSSPLLARCDFIFHTILRLCDEELRARMEDLAIEPQLFMLRWLRLLFCREFTLKATVRLWDAIFADLYARLPLGDLEYPAGDEDLASVRAEAASSSAAMPLVDYLVAGLLYCNRDVMLKQDQLGCLRVLLRELPDVDETRLVDIAKRIRAVCSSGYARDLSSVDRSTDQTSDLLTARGQRVATMPVIPVVAAVPLDPFDEDPTLARFGLPATPSSRLMKSEQSSVQSSQDAVTLDLESSVMSSVVSTPGEFAIPSNICSTRLGGDGSEPRIDARPDSGATPLVRSYWWTNTTAPDVDASSSSSHIRGPRRSGSGSGSGTGTSRTTFPLRSLSPSSQPEASVSRERGKQRVPQRVPAVSPRSQVSTSSFLGVGRASNGPVVTERRVTRDELFGSGRLRAPGASVSATVDPVSDRTQSSLRTRSGLDPRRVVQGFRAMADVRRGS